MAVVSILKRRLILTTALVGALVGYGGRRAYAACNPGGGGTYICDGANGQVTFSANNAAVSTDPGTSFNYSGNNNAITISGDGALSFTDINASTITQTGGFYHGLYMRSTGDDGATPGSITIDTNGSINGVRYGSFARNYGTGAITITADGDVTGGNRGIYAQNDGTDLSVTTGVGTTITGTTDIGIYATSNGTGNLAINAYGDVTGDSGGIIARNNSGVDVKIKTGTGSLITATSKNAITVQNYGAGLISITADGDLTGGSRGIYAQNYGTDLSVTTGVGTTIIGSLVDGISAINKGTGAITITADGDVTGGNRGIFARNESGTDISVTTGLGTTVTGIAEYGIFAISKTGTGAITITADGDVTGGNRGIYAVNSATGTDLSVTTGVGTTITGTNNYGIYGRNLGTGLLSITADGDVTGGYRGIYAQNYGTDLSVTTGAGTTITGTTQYGIYASNKGTGLLTITADGDVTGGYRGIFVRNDGTDLSVTTGAGTTITGTTQYGIFSSNSGTGALTITADGDVTGGNRGIYARNYGTDLSVTTGVGTTITGTNQYSILAANDGTGLLSITAGGDVIGGNIGIAAINYATGTDLSVTTGLGTTITGTNQFGILAANLGTGALTITADGDVTSSYSGMLAINYATGTDLSVTTGLGTTITGTAQYGIYARNYGTGALTITNDGDISGNAGISVYYNGAVAGGITNNVGATIEGTGGTAIDMRALTADLAITINGGRIIGDVTDDTIANGFSDVVIAEDFTSEGSFTVSDFGVSSGKVFTFGAGEDITSFNDVENDGEMVISAAGSAITGGLKVNNGGILTAGDDFSISGQLTNNGTIDIATNKTLTAGTMAAGTGTLTFGVTSLADHAQLTLTGGAANLTGQTITINVAGVNAITATDEILLIDGAGAIIGGPGAVAASVTDNSVLWDFEIIDGTGIGAPTDNSDLFLRVAMVAGGITDLSDTPNNENAAGVLIDLEGNTADPELLDILANLNGAGTAQEFNDIVEAVQPTVDGGAITTSITFADSALNLTGERLSSLRQGADGTPAMTGSNAKEMFYLLGIGATQNNVFGEDPRNEALKGRSKGSAGISGSQMFSLTGVRSWGQLFGQTARQGQRGGIDGYDSGTGGIAVGIDSENIFKHGIAGLAFTYGRTRVDSNNATRTDTDVNSYQLTFYSDHDLGQGIYANAMAGYSFNTNDTLRHDVGGVPGLNAEGDFDSHMISARTEIGKAYAIDNLTLTPTLSANWVHYMAESYRETGAGGANLNVSSKDLDQLELGLGGKAAWRVENSDGSKTVSELHAGYRREMIGDSLETTSSFTGGGAAFSGQGPDPAQDKFNIGAQIKYYSINNIELTAAYDLDIKQDYAAHAGFLRMGWRF